MSIYALIVLLPLIGAFIAGFFGRSIGDRASQIVTCAGMAGALILSIMVFVQVALGGDAFTIRLFTWVISGDFVVDWALRFDTLTAVMLIVVNGVSTMVHVYSIGYMSHDDAKPRFMAYLSLFTFFMLMLVTADNLLQLFFGWEGVGLASYLLIGFWYHKDSANAAAMKAFIVNRVGDVGFALGIMAIFFLFGTVSFDEIFARAPEMVGQQFSFIGIEADALTIAAILLFIGAMGKSAQFMLHTWLPDAMEGPTPVSALIHAATMVTAGVFLVCRMSPLFEYAPLALDIVAFVGATTAIFAATVGLTQFDIKRVIAYSTCSQLGYMFFAAGVSAYGAAMFHLFTHAFFKALLFLGAGAVIHAMSDEQDMRKMGGIWKKIPITYAMMWIGSLALAGVPFFAGMYSKDIVIEAAYAAHSTIGQYAFWMGVIAAFLTAFYSWRLIIMTFHGKPRASAEVMSHIHESPNVMLIPLYVLAVGAVFSGYLGYGYFVGDEREAFWGASLFVLNDTIEAAHHVPLWVKLLPIVVGLVGIGFAYVCYMFFPIIPAISSSLFGPIYRFFYNKWYFDELYDRIFVKPSLYLGFGFWKAGDGNLIDGVGPDGVAGLTKDLSGWVSRLQSGYLYHYAFVMLVGVVIFITWYLLTLAG
ncbi:MAG: NADH-quinone oxidoreductase subunit L [Alphaproteobacteria bacterium]|nr:NADH-quinone oxidoreductase subunit L [Alphaproteobacteria bacterium]